MWFGGPHTIWTWSRLSISSLYVQLDHHILVLFSLYYLRWAPPFVVCIDEPIVRVQDGRTSPLGFEDTFLERYIFITFGQFPHVNRSLQPGFFVAKVVYIV